SGAARRGSRRARWGRGGLWSRRAQRRWTRKAVPASVVGAEQPPAHAKNTRWRRTFVRPQARYGGASYVFRMSASIVLMNAPFPLPRPVLVYITAPASQYWS